MHGPAWILLGNAWAAAMLRACGQGSLCAFAAWAITRCWPRLPATARGWLWWLVCLKLSACLLCITPLALPLLPRTSSPRLPVFASPVSQFNAIGPDRSKLASSPACLTAPNLPPSQHSAPPLSGAGAEAVGWPPLTLLALLWLLGVAATLAMAIRPWLALRRRLGRMPTGPAPRLIETDAVNSPLVLGLLRPVILLPHSGLSADERAMALAHEQAHLRRGDLWLGLLPTLTQALFFFFPLVRWVAREYHQAREEACDAAAMAATGAGAADYARLLLRFTAPPAPIPALGLSANAQALRRRLLTLPQAERMTPRNRQIAAASLTLALPFMLPWRLTATSLPPLREARAGKISGLPDPRTLHFTLTDLGLAAGYATEATGLNDRGQVSECAETDPPSLFGRALVWNHGKRIWMTALPGDADSRANGINDTGQIIVSSYSAYDHNRAFLWKHGHPTLLASLPGFSYSKALGLNNAGMAVGYAQTGSYDLTRELVAHAVLWDAHGQPVDLGTLGGDYSAAYALSDRDQVVGKADTTDFGSTHAFSWQAGQMTDLGTLGGANSLAMAVNDAGQVVGYSETGDATHAFLWQNGTMRDLGTLPGSTNSEAQAINAQGQVVGTSGNEATLWQDGKIVDLNRLLPARSGWVLQQAAAINALGQIAGSGLAPDGRLHAFLLTPISSRFSQIRPKN